MPGDTMAGRWPNAHGNDPTFQPSILSGASAGEWPPKGVPESVCRKTIRAVGNASPPWLTSSAEARRTPRRSERVLRRIEVKSPNDGGDPDLDPPVMMAAAARCPIMIPPCPWPPLTWMMELSTHPSVRVRGTDIRRRREGWSQSKGAGGKSDQQKPFHVSLLPEIALSRQGRKVRSLSEFPV